MSRERTLSTTYLVAVTALGAWLRLRQLGHPSFWFDEIFHFDAATAAARQPLWRWMTIFETENGPLFYAGQLLGRIWHSPEFSARIAPALCGIATIPMIWFAARTISTRALPYIAAVLLAVSPLHVYYSREARPYALVALVTTALLLLLLRGARMVTVVVVLVVSLYSGAVMAPVIAAATVAALLAAAISESKRFWWVVAALSTGCGLLLATCYRPGRYPSVQHLPGMGWPFFRGLLESFSVVAVNTRQPYRGALVFALLAVVGAIALLRKSRQQGIVVTTFGLLTAAIGVTATAILHRPFGVRYVIGALPGYLLLVAAGVAAVVSQFQRRHLDILAGILAAAVLAREGWDAALEEPFQKLNWRTVANAIARHAHENDVVIAGETWTFEQIGFYLRGLTPHLRLLNAGGTRMMGEVFAYQNTTSWLVVADDSTEFAQWACRFPVVLASPLRVSVCTTRRTPITFSPTAAPRQSIARSRRHSAAIAFCALDRGKTRFSATAGAGPSRRRAVTQDGRSDVGPSWPFRSSGPAC